MKKLKVIILLVAMILPAKIFSQSRIFTDLTDDSKIQTQYIGPAMVKLATGLLGSSANSLVGDSQVDVSKIINNISAVEVVKTENNKGKVKKIQKSLDKIVKAYNVQTIIESTPQKDCTSKVLAQVDDYTGVVSKLFVVKKEKKNMQVIVLQGTLNLTDIASLSSLIK